MRILDIPKTLSKNTASDERCYASLTPLVPLCRIPDNSSKYLSLLVYFLLSRFWYVNTFFCSTPSQFLVILSHLRLWNCAVFSVDYLSGIFLSYSNRDAQFFYEKVFFKIQNFIFLFWDLFLKISLVFTRDNNHHLWHVLLIWLHERRDLRHVNQEFMSTVSLGEGF